MTECDVNIFNVTENRKLIKVEDISNKEITPTSEPGETPSIIQAGGAPIQRPLSPINTGLINETPQQQETSTTEAPIGSVDPPPSPELTDPPTRAVTPITEPITKNDTPLVRVEEQKQGILPQNVAGTYSGTYNFNNIVNKYEGTIKGNITLEDGKLSFNTKEIESTGPLEWYIKRINKILPIKICENRTNNIIASIDIKITALGITAFEYNSECPIPFTVNEKGDLNAISIQQINATLYRLS
ncbi:MAG: hypothetical protein KGI80_06205 [Verrucomicrobiota bacterium]|nr:hypothetical protein [Verrucomicrobiota bacterium]